MKGLCPGYRRSNALCGKPLHDPGLWVVGGREYCSERCAAYAAHVRMVSVRVPRLMVEVFEDHPEPCVECLGVVFASTGPPTYYIVDEAQVFP